VGDRVRIGPSRPHAKDGFVGIVRAVSDNTLTVFGGKPNHEAWRDVSMDRVKGKVKRG
jgi:hypothetical protein